MTTDTNLSTHTPPWTAAWFRQQHAFGEWLQCEPNDPGAVRFESRERIPGVYVLDNEEPGMVAYFRKGRANGRLIECTGREYGSVRFQSNAQSHRRPSLSLPA